MHTVYQQHGIQESYIKSLTLPSPKASLQLKDQWRLDHPSLDLDKVMREKEETSQAVILHLHLDLLSIHKERENRRVFVYLPMKIYVEE